MANHPINLLVRFVLELVGLFAYAYWGWTQHDGLGRFLWSLGLPLMAAGLWGTFRVEGDPGKAPVRTPGAARLLLELAYFGGAAWALFASGLVTFAILFAVVVVVHYAVSYDRILWMVKQ